MPIIEFSQDDVLRGKIVEPAYYRVKINSITEKASKDGASMNYPVDATIICNDDNGDETFKDVPLDGNTWTFNSKPFGKTMIINFAKALTGEEIEAGSRFQLSDAEGREIAVFVGNNVYEGRTSNRVNGQFRAVRDA